MLVFVKHWDYAWALRNWNMQNGKRWRYLLWSFDDVIINNAMNRRCRIKNIKIK